MISGCNGPPTLAATSSPRMQSPDEQKALRDSSTPAALLFSGAPSLLSPPRNSSGQQLRLPKLKRCERSLGETAWHHTIPARPLQKLRLPIGWMHGLGIPVREWGCECRCASGQVQSQAVLLRSSRLPRLLALSLVA